MRLLQKILIRLKKNIGEIIFNHIGSLDTFELERMLEGLQQELRLSIKLYGKDNRYYALKEEEWFILYRLGKSEDFRY